MISTLKNSKHYKWGNNCDGWHLIESDEISVIQELMPPGEFEVRHYHQKANQFFFILKGIATIEVEGEVHQILAHQGIEIKAGQVHQLKNESNEVLSFTVTSWPKSHGDRVVVDA